MKQNRVLYIILLLSSIIFIYFYGGKVPFLLFYVIVFLPLVSIIHAIFVMIRFKFTQDVDSKHIMKGDKVKFTFELHNEGLLFYPYMKANFFSTNTLFARQINPIALSLPPYSEKKFTIELECKYRGHFPLGLKSVEIGDLLGLVKLKYKPNNIKYITVFPRIVCLNRFDISSNFISESHTMLSSGFQETSVISDIRKYSYGDTFKKIHWKLSAKMNELMVKNYQATSETNVVLFLDLKSNSFSEEANIMIEDKVIEAIISVAQYCLTNWIHINLIYYFNNEIINIEGKNPFDFDDIYSILSTITFSQGIDLKDIMNVYIDENINKSNLFLFTANLNYDLYNKIHKARFMGQDISVIYISPDEATSIKNEEADNIIDFLPEIGVYSYKINMNDSIKEVLER